MRLVGLVGLVGLMGLMGLMDLLQSRRRTGAPAGRHRQSPRLQLVSRELLAGAGRSAAARRVAAVLGRHRTAPAATPGHLVNTGGHLVNTGEHLVNTGGVCC